MGNHNPTKKWQPGQSGNPNGRPPKGSAMRDILEKIGEELTTLTVDGEELQVTRKEMLGRVLWENVIKTIGKGDKAKVVIDEPMLRHLMNRLEGLPTHRIAGEKEGEAIPLIIRRMSDVDGD